MPFDPDNPQTWMCNMDHQHTNYRAFILCNQNFFHTLNENPAEPTVDPELHRESNILDEMGTDEDYLQQQLRHSPLTMQADGNMVINNSDALWERVDDNIVNTRSISTSVADGGISWALTTPGYATWETPELTHIFNSEWVIGRDGNDITDAHFRIYTVQHSVSAPALNDRRIIQFRESGRWKGCAFIMADKTVKIWRRFEGNSDIENVVMEANDLLANWEPIVISMSTRITELLHSHARHIRLADDDERVTSVARIWLCRRCNSALPENQPLTSVMRNRGLCRLHHVPPHVDETIQRWTAPARPWEPADPPIPTSADRAQDIRERMENVRSPRGELRLDELGHGEIL